MALNFIAIHGRLGRDPEIKEMQGKNGPYKSVNFTVAVGRSYGDETDWFFCTMNGKRAEVIHKFFRKGSQIIVTGRMESYKRQQDGSTSWVVRVEDFDFCDPGTKQTTAATTPEPGQQMAFVPADDDDVPF